MIYENSGDYPDAVQDLKTLADYVHWLEQRNRDLQEARTRAYGLLFPDYDPSSREMMTVPKFNFDLYEAILTPVERYMDVATAEKGYENLLYKNRPVTWMSE